MTIVFSFRFVLSPLRMKTQRKFNDGTLSQFSDFCLADPSPAAPSARAAAPWAAPVPAPLRVRPYLSLLSSSLRDVAPPPAQLSSLVRVAALVGRQLAGQ